jgi:hypothetical protein
VYSNNSALSNQTGFRLRKKASSGMKNEIIAPLPATDIRKNKKWRKLLRPLKMLRRNHNRGQTGAEQDSHDQDILKKLLSYTRNSIRSKGIFTGSQ